MSENPMLQASENPLELAHGFFQAQRPASWAPAYLDGRGFPEPVQRRFELGYAPPGWHTLTERLLGQGVHENRLIALGLARRSRHGRLYDFFRDRIMFPVRDRHGSLAGFIGRTADGVGGPRYLNSPDSAVFHKGSLLYSPDKGPRGRSVVVEGPLDAIAVRLAGFRALAPCGTRLTEEQTELLGDLGDDVLLALDGDFSGRRGTVQAWQHLSHLRGPVHAVLLPEGEDPAALFAKGGPEAVRAALAHEHLLVDLVLDSVLEHRSLRFVDERVAAAHAAAGLIAALPPEQVARQVSRTAARLGFDPSDITSYVIAALSARMTRRF
ncbi:DNA primase [Actinocorallia aurantiaca]|jgi:DNA primase|uniref:Toprim domain-containing protein n=1 Tax=Actinocorallia aurantiaca TaxID=46204 RepID=A0ABP6GQN9_9ACTN